MTLHACVDQPEREKLERRLARAFGALLGAEPAKRRRLALMDRLDCIAHGRTGSTLRWLFDGALDGMSDDDLKPVIAAGWAESRPGAKPGGGVSKWVALSRVLRAKWADGTAPEKLEREARRRRR